ncbi:hypothetical protein, partial [Acinetobacter baumannii]|uniref:hypothetical protein n=1 Tax=Acinetobacter baumannii TaxID=470 RepID=UPI001C065EF1
WAVIASLHHVEIDKDVQRISKLKPYVGRYNWSGIEFLTPKNHWVKFERQNPGVALNVLYVSGEKEVKQAYISKFNSVREKIADLLIIERGGEALCSD